MFLGHFGVGFAAKKPAPQVSLGTLLLAAQWADLLWPVMLITGLEHVAIEPGNTAVTPLKFDHYPFTHSLVFQLGWGVLLGVIYFFAKKDFRSSIIVGALVVSHWVLDFIVHRPDMPIFPNGPFVGLGIWNNVPLTFILEFVIYFGGVLVYYKLTKAKDAVGKYALIILVLFLFGTYLASVFGPPPPDANAIGYVSLSIWLLVPWAYWIDRHRVVK